MDVIPVVEVAVPFLEGFDGIHDVADTLHRVFVADEPQRVGTDDGREGESDVGGRGLVVCQRFAPHLVVVGDQPVGLLGEEGVEEVPGVLGQLADLRGLLFGEGLAFLGEFLPEAVHDEGRCHPHGTGDGGEDGGNDVARGDVVGGVAKHLAGDKDKDNGGDVVEPEFLHVVAQGAFGAFGGLVAGNPGQEVVLADPHAPAGTHGGVGVHPGLLGQQCELHHRAVDDDAEATHEGHVVFVASPEARQLGHLSHDEEDDGTGHHDGCHEQEPRRAGARAVRDGEGVARKDHEHHAQAEHRPAQVVEYFPAADGVHLVLHALATLVAHMGREPGDDLPVAARPAMVALGVVDVVGGVVVEDLHVVDEAAAYVAALQQVVAEDEVLGEGPFEHLLEHAQVVDALAAEGALVEYVLIELEAGGGVDVQSAESGHQLGVAALVGDLDVDVDAGLHDAVAAVHALAVFRQLCHVERMRHRPDELLCRVEHQLRIGVEGNDEAYRSGAFRSPLADGLRAEALLLLLPGGLAEEQVVEVEDGATLAFVA